MVASRLLHQPTSDIHYTNYNFKPLYLTQNFRHKPILHPKLQPVSLPVIPPPLSSSEPDTSDLEVDQIFRKNPKFQPFSHPNLVCPYKKLIIIHNYDFTEESGLSCRRAGSMQDVDKLISLFRHKLDYCVTVHENLRG